MKLLHAMAAVVLFLCTIEFAWGTTVSEGEIEALLRNLVHDDAAVRDRAAAGLVKLGAAVIGPLTQAMQRSDDPELHARAARILLLCKPGGAVVDGLQLILSADRADLAAGADVVVSTVIRNTTSKDINLFVGMSYSGAAFETGSALVARDVHGSPLQSKWAVGFCGTGAHPLNVTIPANGSVMYKLPLKLQPWPEGIQPDGRTTHVITPGPGYRMVVLPDGAEALRLRMSYSATGREGDFGEGEWAARGEPANPAARYWKGAIESNELQLSIDRPAKK